MKRSDAVKILRDIFLTHMNCAYNCCSTDEEMYSKVLSEIQNRIGMQLPSNLTTKSGSVTGYEYEFQYWEDEDEKK